MSEIEVLNKVMQAMTDMNGRVATAVLSGQVIEVAKAAMETVNDVSLGVLGCEGRVN